MNLIFVFIFLTPQRILYLIKLENKQDKRIRRVSLENTKKTPQKS